MGMNLSSAIRLGSMLKPQFFGNYYDGIEKTASCAFGAAYDALGTMDPSEEQAWPVLLAVGKVGCPECRSSSMWMPATVITHLNDTHKWTRERIADLVEQWESLPLESVESLREKVTI